MKPSFNREKLSYLRTMRGWTLAVAAEKFGVSPAAVLKWEQGKNIPKSKHVKLMAKMFGVAIKDFYLGDAVTA